MTVAQKMLVLQARAQAVSRSSGDSFLNHVAAWVVEVTEILADMSKAIPDVGTGEPVMCAGCGALIQDAVAVERRCEVCAEEGQAP